MVAIIRNLNKLDTAKLEKQLQNLGVSSFYIQENTETKKIDDFLRINLEHEYCLVIDSNIIPLEIDFTKITGYDVTGGLILSHTNEPMWNNYGMERNIAQLSYVEGLKKLALNFWNNEEVMQYVKKNINYTMDFEKPRRREVDWVSELFMFVKIKALIDIGGFDSQLKFFHIGPDICKRIKQRSGRVLFDPSLQAKLRETITEGQHKKETFLLEETIYYYKKHYNIDRDTFMKHFYLKEIFEY